MFSKSSDGDSSSLRGVSSDRSARSSSQSRSTGGRSISNKGSLSFRRRTFQSHSNPVKALPHGSELHPSQSFVDTLKSARSTSPLSQHALPTHNDSIHSEFAPHAGRTRLSDFSTVDYSGKVSMKSVVLKIDSLVVNGSLEGGSRRSSLTAFDTVPELGLGRRALPGSPTSTSTLGSMGGSPPPCGSPTITITRSTGSTASKLAETANAAAFVEQDV